MNRLLKEGDIFTCKKFEHLVGRVEFHGEHEAPTGDFSKLQFDHSPTTSCSWTEQKVIDGEVWERKRNVTFDLSVSNHPNGKAIGKQRFKVIHTSTEGGGCGHGPNDYYPDGHHVTAVPLGIAKFQVKFYQSGCFVGMLAPADITLVEET